MGSSPKAPEKSQQQIILERQQIEALNEETAASQRRLKAMARAKTGKKSLLQNPKTIDTQPPLGSPTITPGFVKNKQGELVKDGFGQKVGRMIDRKNGVAKKVTKSGGGAKKAAKKSLVGGLF